MNALAAGAADGAADRDPPDQARLGQLAEEQAALRRVATLVAQATPPEAVFAAVVEEVGRLFRVELANLFRYEPGRTATSVAAWGPAAEDLPVSSRLPLEGRNLSTLVSKTGRPARIDGYADSSSGPIGAAVRETGIRSAVGTPVIVEGSLWGVIFVGSTLQQPLPPDTEARLASFTELVATALANADSRAKLMAFRARIVAAADETRRRIERDLHDGTQQRLVSLGLAARTAAADVADGRGDPRAYLARIAAGLADAAAELQEVSRGIHPAILSERGLGPALRTLANAMKHAQASRIEISLTTRQGSLLLTARDDGSTAEVGTHITVDLPLEYELAQGMGPVDGIFMA